jgi:hypothetical protein
MLLINNVVATSPAIFPLATGLVLKIDLVIEDLLSKVRERTNALSHATSKFYLVVSEPDTPPGSMHVCSPS